MSPWWWKTLDSSTSSKRRLAGRMSSWRCWAHELRNPLAPIRNAMAIFRLKGVADPEIQEVTEMIERQVQQLTRLVDDLLDVSRVGHGKINLQMKPVDLKAVVALAIEISRPLIDKRKHILEVSLPQRAVEVAGDIRPIGAGGL